jgi:hypothetical protein
MKAVCSCHCLPDRQAGESVQPSTMQVLSQNNDTRLVPIRAQSTGGTRPTCVNNTPCADEGTRGRVLWSAPSLPVHCRSVCIATAAPAPTACCRESNKQHMRTNACTHRPPIKRCMPCSEWPTFQVKNPESDARPPCANSTPCAPHSMEQCKEKGEQHPRYATAVPAAAAAVRMHGLTVKDTHQTPPAWHRLTLTYSQRTQPRRSHALSVLPRDPATKALPSQRMLRMKQQPHPCSWRLPTGSCLRG